MGSAGIKLDTTMLNVYSQEALLPCLTTDKHKTIVGHRACIVLVTLLPTGKVLGERRYRSGRISSHRGVWGKAPTADAFVEFLVLFYAFKGKMYLFYEFEAQSFRQEIHLSIIMTTEYIKMVVLQYFKVFLMYVTDTIHTSCIYSDYLLNLLTAFTEYDNVVHSYKGTGAHGTMLRGKRGAILRG